MFSNTERIFFSRFAKVFSDDWTVAIENHEVDLVLEKNAPQIFAKAYTVPFGVRDAVENELKRLVEIGILIPVKKSNYASPIVIVKRPNNSIRICVDCRRTINKYVVMDHYPLLLIEDILADLYECKVFLCFRFNWGVPTVESIEQITRIFNGQPHIG